MGEITGRATASFRRLRCAVSQNSVTFQQAMPNYCIRPLAPTTHAVSSGPGYMPNYHLQAINNDCRRQTTNGSYGSLHAGTPRLPKVRPPSSRQQIWAQRPTVSEMWYANNTEGKRKVRHRETDGMWTTPLMKAEKSWQPMETQVPASAKWYANNNETKRPVIHRVSDGKWSSEQHSKNPILHPTQLSASEKWDANRKEGRRQLRPMYASGPSGDNTTCYVLGGQRVYHQCSEGHARRSSVMAPCNI